MSTLKRLSRIHDAPSPNSKTENELTEIYKHLSPWVYRNITKICKLVSREIDYDLPISLLEIIRDLYLQSNLSLGEYMESTKWADLKQTYPTLFEMVYHYLQRFNAVAFPPIHQYLKSTNAKFTANFKLIISKEAEILRCLKGMDIGPNTCMMVFESRHFIQSSVSCADEKWTEEDESDDDDELEYNQHIYEYENKFPDDKTERQSLQHSYKPLGSYAIYDEDKLSKLFYGYIRKIDGTHDLQLITKPMVATWILYAVGEKSTIRDMMRTCIKDSYNTEMVMKPGTFKHYEAHHRYDNATLMKNESNIPKCMLTSRLKSNLCPILNSVHSKHNCANTITFLYIKYPESLMPYLYATGPDGKSGGRPLTEDNLATISSNLAEGGDINIKLTHPTVEQHESVLLRNEVKPEPSVLNSFHKGIRDVINGCDAELVFDDILLLFDQNGINKEYFLYAKNRSNFVLLMRNNGISTAVANEFWHGLGGVAEEDMIAVEPEDENDDDLELDSLNEHVGIMMQHDDDTAIQQITRLWEMNNQVMNDLHPYLQKLFQTEGLVRQCPGGNDNESQNERDTLKDSKNKGESKSPSEDAPDEDDDNKNDRKDDRDNGDGGGKKDGPKLTVKEQQSLKHPIAILEYEVINEKDRMIRFDASKSKDRNGEPCYSFVFDFGDETPPMEIWPLNSTAPPMIQRPYKEPGPYTVKMTAVDKNGLKAETAVHIEISSIESPSPPTKSIQSPSVRSPSVRSPSVRSPSSDQPSPSSDQPSPSSDQVSTDTTEEQKYTADKKSKKKRRKRGKKSAKSAKLSEPNYLPKLCSVFIPESMITKIIPSAVDVSHIPRLLIHMNKLTELQWKKKNDAKYKIGYQKVLDYGFRDKKSRKLLYCLITRQDESLPGDYKWIMDEKLYNESELQPDKIPNWRSENDPILLRNIMNKLESRIPKELYETLKKTVQAQVPVYNKQTIDKAGGIVWNLPKHRLLDYIKKNKDWKSIAIALSYDKKTQFKNAHFGVKIKTEKTLPDIFVSYKYISKSDSIFITGFHIDKHRILEQHQLIIPYNHKESREFFDSWDDDTNITHLFVGHINQYKDETIQLRKQLDELMNNSSPNSSLSFTAISPARSMSYASSSSSQHGVQGYSQFEM